MMESTHYFRTSCRSVFYIILLNNIYKLYLIYSVKEEIIQNLIKNEINILSEKLKIIEKNQF